MMGDRIDLAAIRARVAAATPGPWAYEDDGDDYVIFTDRAELARVMHGEGAEARADLIAHAPADLAALCAEVERLRAELDDARNVALGAAEDCAAMRERLAAIESKSPQRGFTVVCVCDGVRQGCTLGTDEEPCDCLCHDLEPRDAGEVSP